ncbi:hypothetical protein NEOLI_002797 [Neolecta irregularis DAH-3]|uniref:Uncharacterized protein n=1 Tax=Neolecta irregularis (strain DAH-3) TaxID=1198029 RepID=A0A1U7LQJ2_NEOID|nr:hypothetical protein NEOLI_002797 [Neolecta irregularis DAH-3]|eukprot:OLL24914.1 hypothetical protein NEOLI_002797 [Neolecta irregularis DAH-3]
MNWTGGKRSSYSKVALNIKAKQRDFFSQNRLKKRPRSSSGTSGFVSVKKRPGIQFDITRTIKQPLPQLDDNEEDELSYHKESKKSMEFEIEPDQPILPATKKQRLLLLDDWSGLNEPTTLLQPKIKTKRVQRSFLIDRYLNQHLKKSSLQAFVPASTDEVAPAGAHLSSQSGEQRPTCYAYILENGPCQQTRAASLHSVVYDAHLRTTPSDPICQNYQVEKPYIPTSPLNPYLKGLQSKSPLIVPKEQTYIHSSSPASTAWRAFEPDTFVKIPENSLIRNQEDSEWLNFVSVVSGSHTEKMERTRVEGRNNPGIELGEDAQPFAPGDEMSDEPHTSIDKRPCFLQFKEAMVLPVCSSSTEICDRENSGLGSDMDKSSGLAISLNESLTSPYLAREAKNSEASCGCSDLSSMSTPPRGGMGAQRIMFTRPMRGDKGWSRKMCEHSDPIRDWND